VEINYIAGVVELKIHNEETHQNVDKTIRLVPLSDYIQEILTKDTKTDILTDECHHERELFETNQIAEEGKSVELG
jgi:hypothetical protein